MHCPKCDNQMSDLGQAGFKAFKCEGCSGIWFRDGGHEVARKMEDAAKIDQPETNAAAAYNPMRRINCPECQQPLIRMTDSAQLHIQFEACADCNGVFFDSGEFKDFTEFTFVEQVKQVVDTLKTNIKSL